MRHCYKAEELFQDLPKTHSMKKPYVDILYGDYRLLAADIFAECLRLIVLDIIENNTIFVLPLNFGRYAEIGMHCIPEDEFIDIYKQGSFRNIDFVRSEFKAYKLMFSWKTFKGANRKQYISLNKALTERIAELTNEGKQWC